MKEMRQKLLITSLNEVFEDRLFNPDNTGPRVGFLMYNMNFNDKDENYIIQGDYFNDEEESDPMSYSNGSQSLIEELLSGQDL
jgi:hypothetical protein